MPKEAIIHVGPSFVFVPGGQVYDGTEGNVRVHVVPDLVQSIAGHPLPAIPGVDLACFCVVHVRPSPES